MYTEKLSYEVNGKEFIGFVAYDETIQEKMPVVLIVHAFDGCTEAMQGYAADMAKQGYIGFAIDVYGGGETGQTLDECLSLMGTCVDRVMVIGRMEAAIAAVGKLEQCDASRIAAIGFCFGGKCVLDLARSGSEVLGVVSVHGILAADPSITGEKVTTSVLVLHGYKDSHIPKEDLAAFADEMTHSAADWQMHYFGNAEHAFTARNAGEIGAPGCSFEPLANARSWRMIALFLAEMFAG
jgi:dienelactone hydrolase